MKQIKTEFKDLQSQLDKKTKELESLHLCSSSLSISQPSEDVSIREQVEAARCLTPEDANIPPTFPLDKIFRLRDNLLKHFRAEDVALKHMKDLEIHVSTMKKLNEELQGEQEILQQTTSEQLFQIETLKARLEHHRQIAPFTQKEKVSKLEAQLHELNNKLQMAEQVNLNRNLEVKNNLSYIFGKF